VIDTALVVCHGSLETASILVAIFEFKARLRTVFLEVSQLFCIYGTTSLPGNNKEKKDINSENYAQILEI
jgi:hypothetical protein